MKAIILTGGKGERLRPLTYEIPKALIPIKGRTLTDNILDIYHKNDIYEIWLSVGYKANQIIDKYPFPHFFERTPMGTGGFLHFLLPKKEYWNEDIYVSNGDNLFNIDLKEMMKLHKEKKAIVTIACTKFNDIRQYGSVHIKDDKITSFEEKKNSRIKKSGWINGGYYIFNPQILNYVEDLKKKYPDPISLERDVFPILAKEGKLFAYKTEGQWFDTGTFERYDKVIKEWKGTY